MNVTQCNIKTFAARLKTMPVGLFVIALLAITSSVAIAIWPTEKQEGMVFWTFAPHHAKMYGPAIDTWNRQAQTDANQPVQMHILSMGALNRRIQSGMWAKTPTADLVEIEQPSFARFMAGPVDSVGFYDLTQKLQENNSDDQASLYDRINKASFSAWTSRGKVFGLPHDVHPVLLVYRADLVEKAGIDVSEIQTWADFERVMRPLQDTQTKKGKPRYLLGLWYTSARDVEALLLQAGGGTFDAQGRSLIASDANAKVLSRVVSWCIGPDRIAIDAPEFDPAGNKLKEDGQVVAALMPDWLAGVWKKDLSKLGGKLKLMQLPAWEPGGLRTSVMGGTMLAIPKTTRDFDKAWAFATHLYLSAELAEQLFKTNHIISPVIELWDEPFYKVKDPYFMNQRSGQWYIDHAPDVPERTSSPFHQVAMQQIMDAMFSLKRYADREGVYTPEALLPETRRLLAEAEGRIKMEMSRNVFISGGDAR